MRVFFKSAEFDCGIFWTSGEVQLCPLLPLGHIFFEPNQLVVRAGGARTKFRADDRKNRWRLMQ
jgi:hypothetical protein